MTTTAPGFTGDTATKSGQMVGSPDPRLVDVRWAQRDGFTRVVFDFGGDSGTPMYEVGYSSGPFTDLQGTPVPVAGTAFVQVNLASTSFDLSGAEVRITYEGPDRIDVSSNSVTEVVVLEDFEGVSTWIIGVTAEKPFQVGTLTDPPRVYVDIQD